jgi:hypothetical protein
MMRSAIALIVGCLATAAPAWAQFEPLQFAICKKIGSDSDRLKCFDSIGKPAVDIPPRLDDPPANWSYTESKSPIDDSSQISAVLESTPRGSAIVMRCQENRSEFAFLVGTIFIAETGNTAPVLVRINDTPPVTLRWATSTDSKALFATPAIDFMKLLPDSGKLFLRATGFQGRQYDASFALADVSVARDKVADTCRWSTSKVMKEKTKAK